MIAMMVVVVGEREVLDDDGRGCWRDASARRQRTQCATTVPIEIDTIQSNPIQSNPEIIDNTPTMVRVVIVPGNGAGDVTSCMWYPWIRDRVRELGVEAVLRNMPDSVRARELIWLPFMQDELACGEDTIIVGHSSGAEAAMRYARSLARDCMPPR